MDNNTQQQHIHVPPSYDLFGYLKPEHKRRNQLHLLEQKINVPINWATTRTNASGAASRQELINIRKSARIPDISYDLDKDGYVGDKDYFISKLYDKDNDGKLNEAERKAALNGIAQGIENNYVWNTTNSIPQVKTKNTSVIIHNKTQQQSTINNGSGHLPNEPMSKPIRNAQPFRHYMQIRGKVLQSENFDSIRDTYPEHPLTQHKPHVCTYTELKHKRKQENLNAIRNAVHNWETKNNLSYSGITYNSNNSVCAIAMNNKQLHPSKSEIKLQLHKAARMKCGLDEDESDIGGYLRKSPSLAYIYNPKHKTKSDVITSLKNEINIHNKSLSTQSKRPTEIERLNARESEIFNKLSTTQNGKTRSIIKSKRKQELYENNINKFSKQIIGVHGHELPKFSESASMKEFWKHREGYCDEPRYNSRVEYKESIKYWKPSEELLLNEHRDEPPQSKDPFKVEHHPIEHKNSDKNMILKVNNVNHFQHFNPNTPFEFNAVKPSKHIYRWTTLVNQFTSHKFKNGRFFDSIGKDETTYQQDEKGSNNSNSKEEKKSVSLLSSEQQHYGSDFLVKHLRNKFKGEMKWIKAEHDRIELNRTMKDALYHKFAGKDPNKTNIPKGAIARAKGF